jgi:hypothetical protein
VLKLCVPLANHAFPLRSGVDKGSLKSVYLNKPLPFGKEFVGTFSEQKLSHSQVVPLSMAISGENGVKLWEQRFDVLVTTLPWV